MSGMDLLAYMLFWSLVGSSVFSVLVIFLFRSGGVYIARNQEGLLKEETTLQGILASLSMLVVIIGFLVAANYFGLFAKGFQLGFVPLWLTNFVLYMIVSIFDTWVIDWLVVAVWRPGFLNLPEEMGKKSMREHIQQSILVVPVIGVVLTVLATGISYLVF